MSVLMPARDAGWCLEVAVGSVLRQSLRDLEIVLVDDGSRDGGASRVAVLDPRVRVLRRPREGLVPALNAGLRAARAPLVARMDADDRMHPRRLELQVRRLRAGPDLAAVGSRVHAVPPQAVTGGMRAYLAWQDACLTPEDIADEIYVEAPLVHPTVTYRRDAVLGLGGYRAGDFPEDYDLWLRMVAAGCRLAKLPERLLEWRLSPGSAWRTDPRCGREAFDRLRAAHLARDPRLRSGRPLAIWGAGRRTRRRAGHLLARGFRPAAWIDIDPRKIGNRVGGAPVVGPEWLARPGTAERPFVLGYVAAHGARERMAASLDRAGYRRGLDFLMVG